MRKGGRRLTYTDRLMIERMIAVGQSNEMIAATIGCSGMTIYRELRRGGGREKYTADYAQQQLK